MGTAPLWRSVDVARAARRLVVIDKIPSPHPDDPVSCARLMDVKRRGGNGFMSVSPTHVVLMMAQGVRRLLYSTDDQGVVAALDSRVVTKYYGSFIIRSLPAMWPAMNPEVVRGALRRPVKDSDR